MITSTQLNALIKEVKKDAKKVGLEVPDGIEYKVTGRLTRALGRFTEYRKFDYKSKTRTVFRRVISLSADLDVEQAKKTLMHEVLHSIAGADAGHGIEWTILARKVNKQFPEYEIQRYATEEEYKKVREVRIENKKAKLESKIKKGNK